MSKIAFLGLGNMGAPMAANLLSAGHTVVVFDLQQALIDPLLALGATTESSAEAVVNSADVVISMLPSDGAVKGLYLSGLLEAVDKGALVIDCSTVSASVSKEVNGAALALGIAMIDAPVSGGVGGAKAGTLTFICGGAEDAVQQAESILLAMGKQVFRAGESGAGQIAKICNNMLLAIHMAGTAEALQLGVENGLDPTVLSNIMRASSGQNWSLDIYNPYPGVMDNVPAANQYQGGFQVKLMCKDLGIAMNAALESGAAVPMGGAVKDLYQLHAKAGNEGLDFSSILTMYQEKK